MPVQGNSRYYEVALPRKLLLPSNEPWEHFLFASTQRYRLQTQSLMHA